MRKRTTDFLKIIFFIVLFSTGFLGGMLTMSPGKNHADAGKEIKRPRFGLKTESIALPPPRNYEERMLLFKLRQLSSGSDFKEEFAQLMKQTKSISDNYVKFDYLFNYWAQFSPREALQAAATLPPPFNMVLSKITLLRWGEKKPEELARYYQENKSHLYGTVALKSAVSNWAVDAPEQAIKWLLPLNDSEKKTGIQSILDTVISANPSGLKNILALIPSEQLNQPELLTQIMQKWVMEDPKNALDWMNSLSEQQKKSLAEYRNIPSAISLNSLIDKGIAHPGNVVSELADYPHSLQILAWQNIIENMSYEKGYIEARQWCDSNLPEKISKDISLSIGEDPQSPESFREKIEKLPPGYTLDIALSRYIDHYSHLDYEDTLSYVVRLNHPGFVGSILKRWAYNAPRKAEEWLNRSSLPEEKKKEIRKSLTTPSFIIPGQNE